MAVKATVGDLLAFVKTSEASSTQLMDAVASMGKGRVRLATIKLLSWLKLQQRLGRAMPLELYVRHEWCRDLLQVVSFEGLRDEIFAVRGGAVDLSAGLSDVERATLLAVVDTEYQPPLMTRGRTA